ncbi:MAG: hypothetical protein E7666_00495 [Ruminococcaceae bacterium]|nr:hypothetical protein [Oscillospiraceae bacterium]
MRKLSILLLIIVLLLCMFASCQQPDIPPVDGSDSDSDTESESESETLNSTENGWDPTIQAYWNACVKNGEIRPESLNSTEWNIAAPATPYTKYNTYTKASDIDVFMQALNEIADTLPTPDHSGEIEYSSTTVSSSSLIPAKKSNSISWSTGEKWFQINTVCKDQTETPTYSLSIVLFLYQENKIQKMYGASFTLTESQYTNILETLHAII